MSPYIVTKLGLGIIFSLMLSQAFIYSQAFAQVAPGEDPETPVEDPIEEIIEEVIEDTAEDTSEEDQATPSVSSFVSASYGRLSSNTKPGRTGYGIEGGSTFGGSFSGGLNLSGESEKLSYAFGLSGAFGGGTTQSGDTISSSSGSVAVGGSITLPLSKSIAIGLGNSVGSGTYAVSSVGRGASPIAISHPSGIGLSGYSAILSYSGAILQTGYGQGNAKATIPLVASLESTEDSTEGNLTTSLFYLNSKLLNGGLFLGYRSLNSATTVNIPDLPERLASPGSFNRVPAVPGRINTHKVVSTGIDIKISGGGFSLGIETGSNLKTVDSNFGTYPVTGDYEETSSDSLGIKFRSFAYAQSNSKTVPITFPSFSGTKWEKTTSVNTVEYAFNDTTHIIYGGRTIKDNLDPDREYFENGYGSALRRGVEETNESFIGLAYSSSANWEF